MKSTYCGIVAMQYTTVVLAAILAFSINRWLLVAAVLVALRMLYKAALPYWYALLYIIGRDLHWE